MARATAVTSEENEVYTTFRVDWLRTDPNEVTARLSVVPTEVFRPGDPIGRKGQRRWTHGVWKLRNEHRRYREMPLSVSDILAHLPSDLRGLDDPPDRWDAQLSSAIFLNSTEVPDFRLSAELVQRIAALPAALDWDLYVLSDDRRAVLRSCRPPDGPDTAPMPTFDEARHDGSGAESEDEVDDEWAREDSPPSTCQVALHIEGETIDVDRVSALLGVEPKETRRSSAGVPGAPHHLPKAWVFRASNARCIEWGDALDELLGALPPTLAALEAMSESWRATTVCKAWMSGASGPALVLEQKHLARLAALPASIDLELWEMDDGVA